MLQYRSVQFRPASLYHLAKDLLKSQVTKCPNWVKLMTSWWVAAASKWNDKNEWRQISYTISASWFQIHCSLPVHTVKKGWPHISSYCGPAVGQCSAAKYGHPLSFCHYPVLSFWLSAFLQLRILETLVKEDSLIDYNKLRIYLIIIVPEHVVRFELEGKRRTMHCTEPLFQALKGWRQVNHTSWLTYKMGENSTIRIRSI